MADAKILDSTLTAMPLTLTSIYDSSGGGSVIVSLVCFPSRRSGRTPTTTQHVRRYDVRSVHFRGIPQLRSRFRPIDSPTMHPVANKHPLASRTTLMLRVVAAPAVETITSFLFGLGGLRPIRPHQQRQSIKRSTGKNAAPAAVFNQHAHLQDELGISRAASRILAPPPTTVNCPPRCMYLNESRSKPFSLENYGASRRRSPLLDQALNLHDTQCH
ncbi:hypothetical protein BV898_18493 [Hypsibius exemplaris]|uniref:Uncharacterized protein n=1 Tax=Hypsibius exemplaris TaxID=2072580 RepID=A0A9X6NJE2_HYPEX|nr:hypothetical protein BV898_18493 [Hypsibius exemplaris]